MRIIDGNNKLIDIDDQPRERPFNEADIRISNGNSFTGVTLYTSEAIKIVNHLISVFNISNDSIKCNKKDK